MKGIAFVGLAAPVLLCTAFAQTAPKKTGFEAALNRHLNAIQQRDIAGMDATITRAPDLDLIFPNGKRTTSRADFMAFHKRWFADPNWSMQFERQRVIAGADLAQALYKATYTDKSDGKVTTNQNWLLFTFRKEGNGWFLVHDQNTKLPPG